MDPQNDVCRPPIKRPRGGQRRGAVGSTVLDRRLGDGRDAVPPGFSASPVLPAAARGADSSAGRSADFAGLPRERPGRRVAAEGSSGVGRRLAQVALEHFRQAAATKPDNPQIPISAAAALLRANRPELAVELLTRPRSSFLTRRRSTACWGPPTTARATTNHPKLHSSKHFRWTSRVRYPTF